MGRLSETTRTDSAHESVLSLSSLLEFAFLPSGKKTVERKVTVSTEKGEEGKKGLENGVGNPTG